MYFVKNPNCCTLRWSRFNMHQNAKCLMHIVLYKDKWYLQIILVSAHVQFVNIFVINDTTQWWHPGGWISQSRLFQQRGAVFVQRSHSELQFLLLAFVWFGPLSTWKMPCQYIAPIHPVKTTSAIESEETGPISIQAPICNIVVAVFQFLPDSYSAHPFSLPQI